MWRKIQEKKKKKRILSGRTHTHTEAGSCSTAPPAAGRWDEKKDGKCSGLIRKPVCSTAARINSGQTSATAHPSVHPSRRSLQRYKSEAVLYVPTGCRLHRTEKVSGNLRPASMSECKYLQEVGEKTDELETEG